MPGKKKEISWSGKLGSISFQFVASDFGPTSAMSWSVVRQSTSRSGWTATVSASVATWSSVYSTPPSSHAATSSSSIGREASEMSVWPWQKTSNPPPVPASPTVTWTSGFSSLRSSWAATLMGYTVEEPSTATEPLAPLAASPPEPVSAPASPPPQAARVRARMVAPDAVAQRVEVRFTSVLLKV